MVLLSYRGPLPDGLVVGDTPSTFDDCVVLPVDLDVDDSTVVLIDTELSVELNVVGLLGEVLVLEGEVFLTGLVGLVGAALVALSRHFMILQFDV